MKAQAWKKWFQDFDPGIKLESGFETNKDWKQYVEKQFDLWFERQGRGILKLPGGGQDLRSLLDLMNEVRKPGLQADRVPGMPDWRRQGCDEKGRRVPAGEDADYKTLIDQFDAATGAAAGAVGP